MRILRNAVPPPPPTREGWPLLCALPRATAEDTPGAEWETFVEDGLGDCRAACVEIDGGWVVSMVRALEGVYDHYQVYAFTDEANLPAVLDAVLAAAGLTVGELPWVSVATQPFAALRLRGLSRRAPDACGAEFETPARHTASTTLTLSAGGLTSSPEAFRGATAEDLRPLADAVAAFLRAAGGFDRSSNGYNL